MDLLVIILTILNGIFIYNLKLFESTKQYLTDFFFYFDNRFNNVWDNLIKALEGNRDSIYATIDLRDLIKDSSTCIFDIRKLALKSKQTLIWSIIVFCLVVVSVILLNFLIIEETSSIKPYIFIIPLVSLIIEILLVIKNINANSEIQKITNRHKTIPNI